MLCTVVIAGCAHRAGATIHDDTTVISGHNTIHANPSIAMRTVLVEAAAITVDHGYRYFQLMTPVRPGADVIIRLYGKGDVGPQMPNVYDANAIAAGQIPGAPSRIGP
jgi:hypothetical protein